MFESFVLNKIENENTVINKLIESLPAGESLTRKNILSAELSDFTKNYLIIDMNDNNEDEDLESKISKSNKLYFNYTIRPKWTLRTFLFNNFESRPPNEILKKLELFTFYSFYTDAIRDFINDNSQIFITKNEATSIIDHTNEAIYEKLLDGINNAKIKNFFLQIFILKYDTESNFNLESTVPYSFIKIFLEDKSFPDLIEKFSRIEGLKAETELSLKDILKVLMGKYGIQEKTNVENDIAKESIISDPVKESNSGSEIEIKSVEIKEKLPVSDLKKIEPEIVLPANELLSEPEEEEDEIIIEEVKKSVAEDKINPDKLTKEVKKDKVKNKTEVQRLQREFTEADKDDELKKNFSEKQLEKILNKVYKSDVIYREKSFDKLKSFNSWKEASGHLKEIFKNNDVDLYNKDVVTFVNILNDFYNEKG